MIALAIIRNPAMIINDTEGFAPAPRSSLLLFPIAPLRNWAWHGPRWAGVPVSKPRGCDKLTEVGFHRTLGTDSSTIVRQIRIKSEAKWDSVALARKKMEIVETVGIVLQVQISTSQRHLLLTPRLFAKMLVLRQSGGCKNRISGVFKEVNRSCPKPHLLGMAEIKPN